MNAVQHLHHVRIFGLARELAEMLREDVSTEISIYPRAFFSDDFSLVERQTEELKQKVIALRDVGRPGEVFLSSIGFSQPGKE